MDIINKFYCFSSKIFLPNSNPNNRYKWKNCKLGKYNKSQHKHRSKLHVSGGERHVLGESHLSDPNRVRSKVGSELYRPDPKRSITKTLILFKSSSEPRKGTSR